MPNTWQGEERRKHWRYPCAGEATVGKQGTEVSLPGQLSDISLGGCYIDMMYPLPSETEIDLTLSVGHRRIRAKGRVRASREGYGMGVAFTEMREEERTRLQELINWLAGSFPQAQTQYAEGQAAGDAGTLADSGATDAHSDADALRALEALLQLLERKGLIDHQEHKEVTRIIQAARFS